MKRAGLLACLLGAACAVQGPPPGGPTDRAPPLLLATSPDSLGSYPDWKDDVEFEFDEVVSEGSSPNFGFGTGDLEKLVLVSPSRGVPVVKWKRNRITVRPREGWRPNTVYRIELLPGLADLSSNRSRNGRIISFTTGAPIPTTTLRGLLVDWSTQRPHRLGLIEAVLFPDSLTYRTLTDSLGRFALGPLPPGEYLIIGVIDQNNDRMFQNRENFDSLRIAAGRDSVGELWAFRHDSAGPRLAAAFQDSVSVALTFSQQLNPYQRLPAESVSVRLLPDSIPIPVLAILPKGLFDTTFPAVRSTDTAKARTDSIRAVADSVRADSIARAREAAAIRIAGTQRRRATMADTAGTGPLRTKPPLYDKLFVRVGEALRPGARYVVVVRGIQNAALVAASPLAVFRVPEPPPPVDSAKVKPDTTKPQPRPDTHLSPLTSHLLP